MPDALGRRARERSTFSNAPAEVEDLRVDIMRAVRSICPRWLAEQADDLTQVAISRILDRVRATNGELELSAGYLYRTAYSVVVMKSAAVVACRRSRSSQRSSWSRRMVIPSVSHWVAKSATQSRNVSRGWRRRVVEPSRCT